jgi:hypothetical protein
MLATTRSRERKRFQQLVGVQVGACAAPFAMRWVVQPSDVEFILSYWGHKSALQTTGLSALLAEKVYNRGKSEPRSSKLSLTVWNLRGLVESHLARYPAVQTAQGTWYRPPLVITAAHLVPLTGSELTVLNRRSCAKVAAFCIRTMVDTMTHYQERTSSCVEYQERTSSCVEHPK